MNLLKIRKLCADNHISITKLEEATGLSNGTICKWEGKSPGVENVKKVADHFGVTVDYLLAAIPVPEGETGDGEVS